MSSPQTRPPHDPRQDRLAEHERDLERGRARYEMAKGAIEGSQRAQVVEDALQQIDDLLAIAPPFTSETCLFILGRIHQLVRTVQAPRRIMVEYEQMRESARKLREGLGA